MHDQSASGATLFIEPLAVVELNNELDLCEVQERAEVTRILRSLSELVTKDEQDLRRILYSLAKLDLILAKAKLSTLWDCGGNPVLMKEVISKLFKEDILFCQER